MFCSSCGVQLAKDAKFCQSCGKITGTDEAQNIHLLKQDHSEPTAPSPSISISKALSNNLLAKLLLGLLMCLYGLVIFPAFWGVPFNISLNGGTLYFVSASVFAYLWKKRNKSLWAGAGIGFLMSLLPVSISSFVIGFIGK